MRMKALVSVISGLLIGVSACSSDGISVKSGTTSKADFCKLVIAFKTANDVLGKEVVDGTPTQAKAAMKQIIGQVETLQKRAPADVKGDVDTAAGYINQFDALLSKINYDLAAVSGDVAVADQFQALNTEQVNASRARLGTYTTTECATPPTSTS